MRCELITLWAGNMVFFNGSMKIKICEAVDLRPTASHARHLIGSSKNFQLIDPYISLDVDEEHVANTTTKQRTFKPVWNEEFTSEVHNGQILNLTVYHDAAIGHDEFVSNCSVAFEDLGGKQSSDIWVNILHYVTTILTL